MVTKTKTAKSSNINHLHLARLVCFAVLAAGLLAIQGVAQISSAQNHGHVAAYATKVSINGLLASTNHARATNSISALSLNDKLNAGAQAKANDMITRNYWAHVAPDGTQPWEFFLDAGYIYQAAGENLAYGFDSDPQIITAWMESPGHRENLLGAYKDVGFGIASGPKYQGGEETVVVAFYGTQQSEAAPASGTTTTKTTPPPVNNPPQPKKITNLQSSLNGHAGWVIYASLGLVGATTIGFAGTHWQFVRRELKYGKRFVLLHPMLDIAVIGIVLAIILTSAAGFIR